MTRTEYRTARRLVRDNGLYALRWLDKDTAAVFRTLADQKKDWMTERVRLGLTGALWCRDR